MDLELVESAIKDADCCPTKIKVVGVGGAGGKIIDRMVKSHFSGIEFIAINTDLQDLTRSTADRVVQIGPNTTKGLGAGGVPEIAEKAAMESEQLIEDFLKGSDMVFIACGLGGGTGTGAAPIVGKMAKSLGILSLGIVTTPFNFEGPKKMDLAKNGLEKLIKEVDAYIVIPNENILKTSDSDLTVTEAFSLSDAVLLDAVKGVTDIIAKTGDMNVDFADIRSVLKGAGNVLLGVGKGKGERKIDDAIEQAIRNPLLTTLDLSSASSGIINIAHGRDFKISQINSLIENIKASMRPDSSIKIGRREDNSLKDEIIISVIASGCSNREFDGQKNFTSKNSDSEIIKTDDWDCSMSEINFSVKELYREDSPAIYRRYNQ